MHILSLLVSFAPLLLVEDVQGISMNVYNSDAIECSSVLFTRTSGAMNPLVPALKMDASSTPGAVYIRLNTVETYCEEDFREVAR